MRFRFIYLMIFCPLFISAQIQEINWVKGSSWQEIKQKAREQNKHIFIDCYTTWCGPCKRMDETVYRDKKVIEFANEHFISVKIQMDKTKYDDEESVAWYKEAENIGSYYAVTSYPTFLFLSPNGIPLHKAVGFKEAEQFVILMDEALNPDKQYYNVLNLFEQGRLDSGRMRELAYGFINTDRVLAGKIAASYISMIPVDELGHFKYSHLMRQFSDNKNIQLIALNYLRTYGGGYNSSNILSLIQSFKNVPDIRNLIIEYLRDLDDVSLTKKENIKLLRIYKDDTVAAELANKVANNFTDVNLLNWEDIEFLSDFTVSSSSPGFKIFYKYGKKVNKIVNSKVFSSNIYVSKDFSESIIDKIIIREEIDPYLKNAVSKGHEIVWNPIFKKLQKKYTKEVAQRIVLDGKIALYQDLAEKDGKYWPEFIKFKIEKIERFGTDTTSGYLDVMVLNNTAWYIFLYSEDKEQINTAIKWMKGVVSRNPENENNIDTYANLLYKIGKKGEAIYWQEKALKIAEKKNDNNRVKEYLTNIFKMEKGESTWKGQ